MQCHLAGGRDRVRMAQGALLLLACFGLTCILADKGRVFYEITENTTACDMIAKKVYTGLGSISIASLLVTIFVHWRLPQLNNLHGKILISCSASTIMATTYLIIVYNLKVPEEETEKVFCTILGYFGVYANLSMFSWMTVLCFDMVRTFKRMQLLIIFAHLKRFLAYSIFGWGTPIIICIAAGLGQSIMPEESSFNPWIGHKICFIDKNNVNRQFIFFYAPILAFLLINCIGFVISVANIWRARPRQISGKGQSQHCLSKFAMRVKDEAPKQFVSQVQYFLPKT